MHQAKTPENSLQLYCPECRNPVLPKAEVCGKCLTHLAIPGGRRATDVASLRHSAKSTDPILRALIAGLAVGILVTVFFFVGFFFLAGMVGGAMGTAPLGADAYFAMIVLAQRILGLPEQGVLGVASLFWGAVSAVIPFCVIVFRSKIARTSHDNEV